jgi:hypothetical protein
MIKMNDFVTKDSNIIVPLDLSWSCFCPITGCRNAWDSEIWNIAD